MPRELPQSPQLQMLAMMVPQLLASEETQQQAAESVTALLTAMDVHYLVVGENRNPKQVANGDAAGYFLEKLLTLAELT